jgi:hypothetical protein
MLSHTRGLRRFLWYDSNSRLYCDGYRHAYDLRDLLSPPRLSESGSMPHHLVDLDIPDSNLHLHTTDMVDL